jgi:CheY-like chemotaxis protein
LTQLSKRRYRIALVEDSDEDVFLIREASRHRGDDIQFVRFATVESAIAGLTAPDFPAPDGIILDLNLPCGSGLDVLDAIRRSRFLQKSPVVVLTSSTSVRDRIAAQALDIRAYIKKPTQLSEFEQAVAEVLQTLLQEPPPAGSA